ncbi:hypothetical protein BST81_18810 [Leptolyngbya sp. 'hensonii']|uniref:Cas10/Cmr2 second palm domain-containing protein n=1 Tax=Leptolyngbya sp. 'hensonii' TaxID=1922337 RepID=UPI0009502B0D|nr:type III-B CRISPR-associated protein Cas10/Cmr2 [Leptolyngbya sp. 'hensonii']OLP16752.1 hypothetical protein BST81_18810 [Leptolyngbya sp. 'hensonii']
MTPPVYTAITFAPVQGFIEKSRKLKDLYGSSFILSYLSDRLCKAAQHHLVGTERFERHLAGTERLVWPEDPVVSPALIDVAQGTPNQILIRGEFPYSEAHDAFSSAWTCIVETCRRWIETEIPHTRGGDRWEYEYWHRSWQAWANHAWEFFWATGASSDDAKAALNDRKFSRAWVGINWTGESSSLSGIDSRAWPHPGKHRPYSRPQREEDAEVRAFYGQLSDLLGKATITPREFLSIPELVKRLITVREVVDFQIGNIEIPLSFRDLNRLSNKTDDAVNQEDENANREENKRWTGWFQGDGDRAGDYLRDKEDDELHQFSQDMRMWGRDLWKHLPKQTFTTPQQKKLDKDGRIIYAGGDDFLGVLYRNHPYPEITPLECLQWFERFKSTIWKETKHPITVSVGFVWAAPNVPQRDVLQHCREAEQAAKRAGRDRIAFRILFNSGNYLEWVCPWWLLEGDFSQLPTPPDSTPQAGLLASYCDRRGIQGHENSPNWTHIYTDVATLEARHAFQSTTVALGLIEIYFGKAYRQLIENPEIWWNRDGEKKQREFSGILGDRASFKKGDRIEPTFNEWVINLAKVGFHLTQSLNEVTQAA